jgi:hypothetical protein
MDLNIEAILAEKRAAIDAAAAQLKAARQAELDQRHATFAPVAAVIDALIAAGTRFPGPAGGEPLPARTPGEVRYRFPVGYSGQVWVAATDVKDLIHVRETRAGQPIADEHYTVPHAIDRVLSIVAEHALRTTDPNLGL